MVTIVIVTGWCRTLIALLLPSQLLKVSQQRQQMGILSTPLFASPTREMCQLLPFLTLSAKATKDIVFTNAKK